MHIYLLKFGGAKINFNNLSVTTEDGSSYTAENIISTIPWLEFREMSGIPDQIRQLIPLLRFSSIQVKYFPEFIGSDAHWIYYPDISLPYHRILLRYNFLPESRGYWTETNCSRVPEKESDNNVSFINKYAYPLNTVGKPQIMKQLLNWAKGKNVYGLGRWGEHCHYNSDVTVERALKLAEYLN